MLGRWELDLRLSGRIFRVTSLTLPQTRSAGRHRGPAQAFTLPELSGRGWGSPHQKLAPRTQRE